jgi:hypothetical protein
MILIFMFMWDLCEYDGGEESNHYLHLSFPPLFSFLPDGYNTFFFFFPIKY